MSETGDGGPLDRDVGCRYTRGPWRVVTRKRPHYLGGAHVVREIHTAWDHPQAKGPLAIVGIAVGIGRTEQSPVVQFVHIDEADALLISAAPDLLEALEELRYACTDKAERMADAAIAKALGLPPNAGDNRREASG